MNNNVDVKYRTEVDGKQIWVFDTLCPAAESKELYTNLVASPFKRDEFAKPETQEYRHWAINFNSMFYKSLPVYQRCLDTIKQLTGKDYQAYRGYVNHATFGDMLFTHTDCKPGNDELTILVYICDEWNLEWGGETLFFNNEDDCVFACTPKPGRVVIFNGAIKHVGRPPNRICFHPRYTLAFKMERDHN
ncbi:2OG-Fe(II) oxygenase [Rheinheimera baltica]|uniref:2OG-Fe(II) oxygenase n=1 Tax=Rheinheimera baltica TaxID=67576 RepID=UPI00273D4A20|nr:2OG-Fe(II) oxygenase [Rheinheimera baltica]MDP5189495.1 2OG-Fe(II) oxygenase [Rheinheimera baltica]